MTQTTKIAAWVVCLTAVFSALSCAGYCPLVSTADGISVDRCVTWAMQKGVWQAEYYAVGEVPVPPVEKPTIDNADYFYNFVGWQKLNSPEEVNAYYAEPGLKFGETFIQKPFEPISSDVVYAARYYKVPKKFAVNDDTNVDMQDTFTLLNHLAGDITNVGPGADADGDGLVTVMDVSKLLHYLSTGKE